MSMGSILTCRRRHHRNDQIPNPKLPKRCVRNARDTLVQLDPVLICREIKACVILQTKN